MSWGYKILFTYVAFVGAILFMVYVASQQTNDMQEDNYYVRELAYQDIIDGKNNLHQLVQQLEVKDTAEWIVLRIPQVAATALTDGKIYFLRPSNKQQDVQYPLSPDASGTQLIPKKGLAKGWYTLKISWKSNGKPYFSEQSYNVP